MYNYQWRYLSFNYIITNLIIEIKETFLIHESLLSFLRTFNKIKFFSGINESDENCDDGNINNQDGCDSICQIEDEWEWTSIVPQSEI